MPSDYSMSDVLERIYHNQPALETAVMELMLQAEKQGLAEVDYNVRGKAGHNRSVRAPATSNKA
ncbi:hypothetical protein [Pseudomonas sp. HY7a-MNA-CIBAN-0227]|uniref:hypothetical protein n=1 Tax=Pseudomonas sp. HY7a-MNA-CIBAN-0227 TaxID=3140474 RepID=UPI0033204CDB